MDRAQFGLIRPSVIGSLQFALAKHDQDTDTMHKNQGHKEETHKKPSEGLGAHHGLNRASKNGFFIEKKKKKEQENHQKNSPLPKNKINQKGHFHPTKWISISIITQTFHFNSHETNSNSQLGFI